MKKNSENLIKRLARFLRRLRTDIVESTAGIE